MNSLDTVYLHDTALTMATNHKRDKERVQREEVSETKKSVFFYVENSFK